VSVTPSSTIVGVFRDRSEAEQAVNALYNAGFGQEQIQYMAPGTSGSFFEGLKNFLTGTGIKEGGGNLANDLTSMGLPDNDARYYASEYNNGNPILVVRAAERGTEAMNVLRQYGAYNTQTESAYSREVANDMQQSGDYTQQSSYGAPGQYDNIQNLETQPQAQTGEEHPYAAAQAGNVTPDYGLHDQDTQPVTPLNDAQAQDMQADTVTPAPAYDMGNQTPETDTAMGEQKYSPQADQTATPATTGYDSQMQQAAQTTPTTSNQDIETQPAQASAASPEQTDELEQLQTQLQALQQQLQEAKARLQAAKEQENQVKTAREREQQLQSARQQLQDAQAELQATLAEYQEVQSRMAQYQ
jgi:hypothetical protein